MTATSPLDGGLVEGHRQEDGNIIRAMYSMSADHAQALRREEERGYAKGLADARAEGGRP